MLRKAKTLRGYTVRASDGEIGKLSDLYFDDQTWTVRYFVAQAGSWSPEKRVLIAPRRIGAVDQDLETIDTTLALAEVKTCRPAECDMPLSERMEVLHQPQHFWPTIFDLNDQVRQTEAHLRSMEEVEGYAVAAIDGDIGHVDGFVVDDTDWVVRYLTVNTRNLWPGGKHVLMSPEWIKEVDWSQAKVHVDLPRTVIKESPEFDPDLPLSREYEADLCHFYDREGYWAVSSD